MEATLTLSSEVGIKPACESLNIPRSGFYRTQARKNAPPVEPAGRLSPPRALSAEERQGVLDILHLDRFVDKAPHEVYATLLDEGQYHCSISTMYRILDANTEVKERRSQLSHPVYQKPELLATAPNQVWSWDITKLLGPVKWSYCYLYVILDIFQPLRGGLDDRPGGIGDPGRDADQRGLRQAEHREGPAHDSRGPGLLHEIKARGVAVVRPGGHQDPQQAPYER